MEASVTVATHRAAILAERQTHFKDEPAPTKAYFKDAPADKVSRSSRPTPPLVPDQAGSVPPGTTTQVAAVRADI
jgi:hypothetical protein